LGVSDEAADGCGPAGPAPQAPRETSRAFGRLNAGPDSDAEFTEFHDACTIDRTLGGVQVRIDHLLTQ